MEIDTEELATRLDAWRAERDGDGDGGVFDPPADGGRRRRWLSDAAQRIRRKGLSPIAGRRSGTGQALWDAREVDRILRPSWKAIARRAIRSAGDRGIAVRDLQEALLREGYELHAGTIWAWLRGLRERGLVHQPEHGRWAAWVAPRD